MIVTFKEENHHYESDPPIKWTSVTKVIEMFCEQFDAEAQAWKSAENQNSKWYGMDPAIIRAYWECENERSTITGQKFHKVMEDKAIAAGFKEHRGKRLPVYPTLFVDGVKTALDQVLIEGVYPEHILYSEEHGICGQTDLPICDGEYIDIFDYKTNKEIEMQGYGWQYGRSKKMLGILRHLDDCNFNHYSIQMSLYMKLALLKNKHLKPGKIELIHTKFEIESYDQFGFPVTVQDSYGNPIVTSVKKYSTPYLEKESNEIFEIVKEKKCI